MVCNGSYAGNMYLLILFLLNHVWKEWLLYSTSFNVVSCIVNPQEKIIAQSSAANCGWFVKITKLQEGDFGEVPQCAIHSWYVYSSVEPLPNHCQASCRVVKCCKYPIETNTPWQFGSIWYIAMERDPLNSMIYLSKTAKMSTVVAHLSRGSTIDPPFETSFKGPKLLLGFKHLTTMTYKHHQTSIYRYHLRFPNRPRQAGGGSFPNINDL